MQHGSDSSVMSSKRDKRASSVNTHTLHSMTDCVMFVHFADTLLPTLTVEEMLMYTAELKRPISEPLSEKKAAVDELIDKLALESCR